MEFIDLKEQYKVLKKEINSNINKVLKDGQYIMGDEVHELENRLAKYVGVKYCVACANGTDALQIALMCFGIKPGDAVFVPSLTFFSTSEVVSLLGATPIFVDVDERTFNMDYKKLKKAIDDVKMDGKLNPKAIIAVDLYGLPANFKEIRKIAKANNLLLLEDGAQGFGGSIDGKRSCSFGDISTTSFFPAKPLGCYGDGGAMFTDNEKYYELMKSFCVHGRGSEKYDNVRVGLNSRLDTIQASILLVKLDAFEKNEVDYRHKWAKKYDEVLENVDVIKPIIPEGFTSSYAQYTLVFKSNEQRDFVRDFLKENGIPTMIYYPKPLHMQKVYDGYDFNLNDLKVSEKLSTHILSVPMHPYLNDDIINQVCDSLKKALEEFGNE
jgi:dTDP-4-amino-4,6-dideoxygalactose transaminase